MNKRTIPVFKRGLRFAALPVLVALLALGATAAPANARTMRAATSGWRYSGIGSLNTTIGMDIDGPNHSLYVWDMQFHVANNDVFGGTGETYWVSLLGPSDVGTGPKWWIQPSILTVAPGAPFDYVMAVNRSMPAGTYKWIVQKWSGWNNYVSADVRA